MADVTVAIVTRDRRDRVRRAVASVLAQSLPVEILVLDDGSTDGTVEMLRETFPGVTVDASATGLQGVAQRNRALRLAATEHVLVLDDDASLTAPDTITATLRAFDDPRVAVVTLPYVNVRRETHVRQAPPGPGAWAAGVFSAGASAYRRSAFLAVGGFAEGIGYQGEEGDLALRLTAAGHVIRMGHAAPLAHDEADPVKPADAYFHNARNEVYLTWMAVPRPHVVPRLVHVAAHAALIGLVERQLGAVLRGVAAGARLAVRRRGARRPVPVWAYRLTRELRRGGPQPMDDVLQTIEAHA